MKSSKPFSFVLWVDDERLPAYLAEWISEQKDFDYFHYIRHEAEAEKAPILKRATKTEPKVHWHCLAHFRKAVDYDMLLRPRVVLWAKDHPEYGEMPFTYVRTHEGKVNNISTWLAYVVHEARYMAHLERMCDKPETHKREYSWDDIQSSDYDLLNAQVTNALAFIERLDETARRFEDAKDLGISESRLSEALRKCKTYPQMLAAKTMFLAVKSEDEYI